MSKELLLNPRQRKFLKFYVDTGNASQAAIKAGYKHCDYAFKIIGNDRFQSAYQRLLDKRGITDARLVDVLKEGLEATKVQSLTTDDSKGKTKDYRVISTPDHAVRHKFLETGLKLKKRLGEESKEKSQDQPVSVSVQIVHVRRTADLPSPERRSGDEGNILVAQTGESDGLDSKITSSIRRVQVG